MKVSPSMREREGKKSDVSRNRHINKKRAVIKKANIKMAIVWRIKA